MSLILTRSPFYINKGNLLDGATATISIGRYNGDGSESLLESYSVIFRGDVNIDISPYIRDFFTSHDVLKVSVTLVEITGQTVATTHYVAVDGYGYYEEGANKDFTDYLTNTSAFYAGSNNTIYRNRKEPITIPLLNPQVVLDSNSSTIIKYYDGHKLLSTSSVDLGLADRIQYTTLYNPFSFRERVEIDGGIVESEGCSKIYDYLYSNNTPTRVVISPYGDDSKKHEIKVVPVTECKHEPYKLIFTNKLGVTEDLWFFKKSTNNISTKREEYKANTVSDYVNGDLSKHSYSSYNINGRESISMNTGFIPESFKENIKQLMLSETVWIEREGVRLPVTIKNSQMMLKQAINEKLINYEIEIEFAYDTINNIS